MENFIFGLLLLLIPFQCALTDERLIICGHPNLPPYMWKQNNAITGASVTVIKTILSKLNINIDATYRGDWKRCLYNIKTGKADLVVSAYQTIERKQFAEFTKTPIATYPLSIFVWKGREIEFTKWTDLNNLSMAAVIGDSFGQEFDRFINKNVSIYRVRTNLQQYKMLESGRINFYPNGRHIGIMQLQQAGYLDKIVPLNHPVLTNELFVGMSKKSKFLRYLPSIDQRLANMAKNGVLEIIIKNAIEQQTRVKTTVQAK